MKALTPPLSVGFRTWRFTEFIFFNQIKLSELSLWQVWNNKLIWVISLARKGFCLNKLGFFSSMFSGSYSNQQQGSNSKQLWQDGYRIEVILLSVRFYILPFLFSILATLWCVWKLITITTTLWIFWSRRRLQHVQALN